MKLKSLVFFSLILTFCLGTFLQPPLQAQTTDEMAGFDPNYILADSDIFSLDGMDKVYLDKFLRSKGVLADLMVEDIDGVKKTASDVIWRVANSYKINPKYLLVILQKEQSLVEDFSPSQKQLDWATGFAVCDSCSMDDPDIAPFRGFANQVEWAAKQHREKYYIQLLTTGTTISGKGIGISMNIDGTIVIPANHATAMLYTYTPHIHGNYNLWKIWRRWFSLKYPNGTFVKGVPSNTNYLITLGEKREFASETALMSMTDTDKVIEVPDLELTSYPDGEPIKYAKFSLLKNEDGEIYLLVSNGRRKIDNMKTFWTLGFLEDEVIDVNEDDMSDYPALDPITELSAYPQGALVKSTKSNTVWYVESGVKHALLDEVYLKLYFSRRPIKTVAQDTIDDYTLGDPYELRLGELVRSISSPAVYVVEDEKLRPIDSAETFEAMGWKWQNIVMIPDRIINNYLLGDIVKLDQIPTNSDKTLTKASQ
ncbi:hypothetical protein KKG46_00110 [Patescibacteria group bacterium]|nr:hypothetical protein [Patescibacteria group bacterium]